MTTLVMSILFTIITVSICMNFYMYRKSRRKASAKEVSSVLMQGIQEVNDLAAVRQSFQSIVMYEDSRSLFGFQLPGTHKKFMLMYSGDIVAGADLSKVNITQFVSGRIKLVLPHSKIIDITMDMKNIKVYDQRSGFFNSLSFDEQNRAIAEDLFRIEEEARSSELLMRSDNNAGKILVTLCRSIGIEAEVEFIEEVAIPEPESVSPISAEDLSYSEKLSEESISPI